MRERTYLCMFCCSTVDVMCSSLRQSGQSALVSLFSGWLPYITESLMSPDRVRVMSWGSQRQVDNPPHWAELNVLRGCYTVIKNDSVSYLQTVLLVTTEETCGHKNSGSFLVYITVRNNSFPSLFISHNTKCIQSISHQMFWKTSLYLRY